MTSAVWRKVGRGRVGKGINERIKIQEAVELALDRATCKENGTPDYDHSRIHFNQHLHVMYCFIPKIEKLGGAEPNGPSRVTWFRVLLFEGGMDSRDDWAREGLLSRMGKEWDVLTECLGRFIPF